VFIKLESEEQIAKKQLIKMLSHEDLILN